MMYIASLYLVLLTLNSFVPCILTNLALTEIWGHDWRCIYTIAHIRHIHLAVYHLFVDLLYMLHSLLVVSSYTH